MKITNFSICMIAFGRSMLPLTGNSTHSRPASLKLLSKGPPARRHPTVTEYPFLASSRATSTHCVSEPPNSSDWMNMSTCVLSCEGEMSEIILGSFYHLCTSQWHMEQGLTNSS